MSLPNLPAGDKYRREVRTEWGGLNLNESAAFIAEGLGLEEEKVAEWLETAK